MAVGGLLTERVAAGQSRDLEERPELVCGSRPRSQPPTSAAPLARLEVAVGQALIDAAAQRRQHRRVRGGRPPRPAPCPPLWASSRPPIALSCRMRDGLRGSGAYVVRSAIRSDGGGLRGGAGLRTRFLAGAVTAITLATVVAASPASALPPGGPGADAARVAAPAPAPAPQPAVPTFVNGLAQAVFSTNPADWSSGEVWVQTPFWTANNTSPTISTRYESTWVPRGFAVVHAESPGTGYSDGCPTSGGRNETLAAKAVIDWLDGRVPAYTTRTGDTRAVATWTTGKVGMIGTSYNGTIPEAVATTGVPGLEAIVPISAISDWYDYYRANGMVRAPHSSSSPSGDNNAFQGEDLDVLADVVYSRIDEVGQRTICQPEIDYLKAHIDRATGNRNAVWQERNYMKDVENVHAAALLAHGNNDFNVMTKNAAQFYDALKKQGVPHMFYFHQGGHGGAPPDVLVNYWFTRYLYGVHNGVENLPRSWVVREAASCPPRQTTVTGDQSNTATLVVADTSPFRIGFTLTVPQTNADGTTTSTTRLITDIPDSTHLVLASAVATAAGQKVADGAVVSLVCGPANPTPYAEWPDPASRAVALHLTPGAPARGGLTLASADPDAPTETLTDDASIAGITSANTASSNVRLIYETPPLTQPLRISAPATP